MAFKRKQTQLVSGSARKMARSDIKKMVRSMIEAGRELKFYNTTVSATLTSTPTVYAITQPIVQGIGGGQRVGDDILMKKILFKFRADMNQSNTVLSNAFRFILFTDQMNVGAFPLQTELLTGSNVTDLYALEMIKEKRFKILHDKVYELSLNGTAGISFEKTIKLSHPIYYNDSANTAAANGRGSIWLMLWDNLGANHVGLNGSIEVRYTDA